MDTFGPYMTQNPARTGDALVSSETRASSGTGRGVGSPESLLTFAAMLLAVAGQRGEGRRREELARLKSLLNEQFDGK